MINHECIFLYCGGSTRTNVRHLADIEPNELNLLLIEAGVHTLCQLRNEKREEMIKLTSSLVLRRLDSNERPLGYEPNELPLLHSAIFVGTKILFFWYNTNIFLLFFYLPAQLPVIQLNTNTLSKSNNSFVEYRLIR